MTVNTSEATNLTPVTPGTIVTADNENGSRVWLYVITPLPDNQAFGVTFGVYLDHIGRPFGEGEETPAIRFLTGRNVVTSGNSAYENRLSALGESVRDALATFLRAAGLSLPDESATSPEGTSEPSTEAALEEARRQARQEERQRWEAEKERINEFLVERARDNGLCSEFERAMEDLGWRGRHREYEVEVEVTATMTVTVTAENEDHAAEVVSEDPWSYLSTYSLTDVANVEVTGVTEA